MDWNVKFLFKKGIFVPNVPPNVVHCKKTYSKIMQLRLSDKYLQFTNTDVILI